MLSALFSTKSNPREVADAAAPQATETPRRTAVPVCDIYEDDAKVVVVADLPGVDRDGLNISLHRGLLTIEGTPKALESGRPLWRESGPVRWRRAFTLADSLDGERISAAIKDGVLRLELPKVPAAQPRRIEISAA